MYKFNTFITAFIAVIGITGIAFSLSAAEFEITLGVGDSKTVGKYGLEIGFYGILLDCRCPEGVLCFWEGDAVAKIWAVQPPHDQMNFELHTYHGFEWEAEYVDYFITLVQVSPYPSILGEIDPNEYTVTLIIDDDLASIEPSTWSRIKALL
jgi:hypothetical protein